MAWSEALAAILYLTNSLLLVRRSIWNFPVGIAAVSIYGIIFFEARLYSDMLLQIFYVIVQLYGWHNWSRSNETFGEIVVLRMSRPARASWVAGILATAVTWGWIMHRYTDAAAPWLDAGVAMTAVAAQILLTQRRIETWILWITVNIASIILYASRELYITVGLFSLMLPLAVWSLFAWRKAERLQQSHSGNAR